MNWLIRSVRGYLCVRLFGKSPERFLNLCAANGIFIWNLRSEKDSCLFCMMARDFRRCVPLCKKSGCRLHILEKNGIPFFLFLHRKRKGFFCGIILFAIVLWGLSGYIWNIHVDGNYANSTDSILLFLEQQKIHHGISKKEIVCQEIAAQIRQAFPNITWVSAKIQGTQLQIEIKENVDSYPETDVDPNEEQACDLVASKDGMVVSIITRNGIPMVEEGTVCNKNDVLVSGAIPIQNDAKETIRTDYVHADSDIYLETTWYYYKEFSRSYIQRTYSNQKRVFPFLEIAGWRLDLQKFFKIKKPYVTYEKQNQFFLTENFALPFFWGTVTTRGFFEESMVYDDEKCREIATHQLESYLDELEKMGVQISQNNVKIKVTDTQCIAKGEIKVIEQAIREAPCAVMDHGKEQSVNE